MTAAELLVVEKAVKILQREFQDFKKNASKKAEVVYLTTLLSVGKLLLDSSAIKRTDRRLAEAISMLGSVFNGK